MDQRGWWTELYERKGKHISEGESSEPTPDNYAKIVGMASLHYLTKAELEYRLFENLDGFQDNLYRSLKAKEARCKQYHIGKIPVHYSYIQINQSMDALLALLINQPEITRGMIEMLHIEYPNPTEQRRYESPFWDAVARCIVAILNQDTETANRHCERLLTKPYPKGGFNKITQYCETFGPALQAILDKDVTAFEAMVPLLTKLDKPGCRGDSKYKLYHYTLGMMKLAQVYGLDVTIDNPNYPNKLLHLPPRDFSHIDHWWDRKLPEAEWQGYNINTCKREYIVQTGSPARPFNKE